MNEYQQQVWALSNALAGLLRDAEASKFPPTLRQKTRELQQSCDRLQHYIATSTSRIRKDVAECIEDLEAIRPSAQNPARLRRKLNNVEEYLVDISETFQSQESRAQDLEFEIRCLEDDFFRLQKETEQTTTGYEFGVKVFAVCAVVAFAAVAIPALATAGGAAAAGTAAAEGAALTVGGATVAEGAAVAAGTAAVAEGAAFTAGTAAAVEGAAVAAGTAAAVEGAAVAGISAEAVAVLSGGAALALKGGADGCRQLGEFLDRQQHSVSEHRGFVKQLETEIDVMKDDVSKLEKRLNRASDAIEDDDIEDAARICGRLAGRLSVFLAWRAHERKGDARFDGVKDKFGRFLVFWIVQGMWVMLISMPNLFINSSSASRPLNWFDWLLVAGFAYAVVIEILADIQTPGILQSPLWGTLEC
ncbi:unnamed protein product [Symbiodinium microadriaticum]|nr:unnamed protein product [Symbiodinium microadriaticum]